MTRLPGSWPVLAAFGCFAAVACTVVLGDIPEGRDPRADASTGGQTGGSAGQSGAAGSSGGQGGAAGQGATGGGGAGGAGAGGASGGQGGGGGLAGAGGGGGAAGAGCCDCDKDGEGSVTCGGKDCDDADSEVFSTQKKFFTKPSKTQGYDYDCSGTEEQEFPNLVQCVLALCDSAKQAYFAGPPACGGVGDFGYCTFGVPCKNNVIQAARPHGCR